MKTEVQQLSERIDNAMREHAYSHKISNSPNNFYCNPSCVSEHLQLVVTRETKPFFDIKAVLSVKFPLWDGTPKQLQEIVDDLERSYSDT